MQEIDADFARACLYVGSLSDVSLRSVSCRTVADCQYFLGERRFRECVKFDCVVSKASKSDWL